MKRFFVELGVVLILLGALTVFSARSYAQGDHQPAPCDPLNNPYVQVTVGQNGACGVDDSCLATHESCVYELVVYDNFYGTTCSDDYEVFCVGDILPGIHRMPYPGIQALPAPRPRPKYSPVAFQSGLRTPIVFVATPKVWTLPTRRQSRFYWKRGKEASNVRLDLALASSRSR
jgi:hypothetical protein